MTLQDVIDTLAGSELSNLFVFDDDTQTITSDSRAKLIPQLNLGLQLLHSRFFLKEGTEVINMSDEVWTYQLQNPDVYRIEKVEDTEDNEYLLDAEGEPESFFRLNQKTLRVPKAFEPRALVVTYRAGPEKLKTSDQYLMPQDVVVDLPEPFMEALVLFIASRFLNPMGAGDGFHEGNNYAAKYEAACRMLENQNYDLDRHDQYHTFQSAGWV